MSTNGKLEVPKSESAMPLYDPRSLVAKLAEACDAVGGIEKKGRNREQGYDYVKAADVAKAIRHELFSRGVIIVASESELRSERIETNNGKWMTEVQLRSTYTITDGGTSLHFDAWGVARDSGDKAVYKAKTAALKYFLRGLGLIPDEKDDPEADESVDKPENAPAPSRRPAQQAPAAPVRITAQEKSAFWSAAKKSGKTQEQVMEYFGAIGIEQTDEMTKKDFPAALKWAMEAA